MNRREKRQQFARGDLLLSEELPGAIEEAFVQGRVLVPAKLGELLQLPALIVTEHGRNFHDDAREEIAALPAIDV